MKTSFRRGAPILGAALLLFATLPGLSAPAHAQAPTRTFPETGKALQGKFLQYWLSHGGLAQQGLPISSETSERSDTDGKTYTVQYFERAVFEYHPEAAPNDVLLSLLGSFAYQQRHPSGTPGQQPNSAAGSVLFPETGKRVGGIFLQYWQTHGGLAQQGLPISDEFVERNPTDGKEYRVQYFERAVFEWHPENPAQSAVLLSLLGSQRYQARYGAAAPPPAAQPVPAAAWEVGQVTRVIDGDTIDVSIGGQVKRVRYIGVNTPETVDPRVPVECYGKEASAANKAMVEGKAVYLEKDVSETDSFGRLLRYIFTADAFINAELVAQGFAYSSAYPPDVKYQGTFDGLQQDARAAGRGLWGAGCQGGTRAPTAPTATPVPSTAPQPPPPPVQQPPTSGTGNVVIASVYYDGQEFRSEGDEYVVIRNAGSAAVNLQGWRINAGDAGQDFVFPSYVLQAGAEVRVYTNRDIAGSFSFDYGRAIWNNDGDCGRLYDAQGALVDEYCY
jgi:endonuclease YncB( thermonuclease family)